MSERKEVYEEYRLNSAGSTSRRIYNASALETLGRSPRKRNVRLSSQLTIPTTTPRYNRVYSGHLNFGDEESSRKTTEPDISSPRKFTFRTLRNNSDEQVFSPEMLKLFGILDKQANKFSKGQLNLSPKSLL